MKTQRIFANVEVDGIVDVHFMRRWLGRPHSLPLHERQVLYRLPSLPVQ